jgi:hypothetical protein
MAIPYPEATLNNIFHEAEKQLILSVKPGQDTINSKSVPYHIPTDFFQALAQIRNPKFLLDCGGLGYQQVWLGRVYLNQLLPHFTQPLPVKTKLLWIRHLCPQC